MKKVCAIILSVIMCATMLMAVPFTAEASDSIYIYEGFEDEAVGIIPNGITYRSESEIFGNTFYTEGATIEIVEDGYNGKCFKATENGGSPFQLGLEYVAPTADEPVYVNFKIKILEDMGKPNIAVDLNYSGYMIFRKEAAYPNGPVIFMQGRKDGYYYENNMWYDVSFKFMAGSSDSDAMVESVVRDEKGHVYTGHMEGRKIADLFPFIKAVHGYDKNKPEETGALEGTSILLDEISIIKGSDDATLKLISANYGKYEQPAAETTMDRRVIATEGFNDASITNIHNYANASEALSAPALWDSYTALEMIEDGNGGYAPQLAPIAGKQACISTEPVAIGDDKTFVFFRFNVVDQGDGCICMTLNPAAPGGSNGHDVLIRGGRFDTQSYWGSKSNITYTPNKWYNFVFEFENVEGTNQATLHIYDDQYNKVFSSAPVPGTVPTNGAGDGVISNALISVYQYTGGGWGTSTWAIDDVKILKTTEEDSEAFICNEFDKTYFQKEVIMEEGFNDATISNLHSYMGASTGNGKFINVGFWNGSYVAALQMIDDCKGGYAPQVTMSSENRAPWLNTVSADFTDTGKAFSAVRFKVVDDKKNAEANLNKGTGVAIAKFGFGTADSMDSLGHEFIIRNGKLETWHYWGKQYVPYVVDMWYTIVMEFRYVDGVKKAYLHVYDDQGNKVLYGDPASATGAALEPVDMAKLEMTLYKCNTPGCEAVTAFDDFKVLKTTEEDSEAFIKSEILGIKPEAPEAPEVKDTVYTANPVITVQFDRLVGETAVATFKAEGKNDVEGVIRYAGSSIVEIAPATPLYYDTDYVLDLSGIKGVSGQGMAADSAQSISFHTAPFSMGTVTVGEKTVADGKLTVPVTFVNEEAEELSAILIVTLFDGDTLAWSNTKYITGGEMGENTFVFENIPEGAEEMNLKVFVWDGIKPVYK